MPDDSFIPDEVEETPVEEPEPEVVPEPDGTEEWGNGTMALAQHLFKGVIDDEKAVEQRRVELIEWDTAVKDEVRGGAKQDVDE